MGGMGGDAFLTTSHSAPAFETHSPRIHLVMYFNSLSRVSSVKTSHLAVVFLAVGHLMPLSLIESVGAAEPAARVVFNRDIRPLLSDRCFHCHGPDAKTREADLRLDTEAGSRADLGGSAAIEPGNTGKSELWNRVTSNDPDLRMPPGDDVEPLDKEELELLRRWIEQGADYEAHWSFAPLARPAVPTLRDQSSDKLQQGETPIDQFIRARQLQADAIASGPADRVTLIRRVSFDLTGLPPTSAEVAAFVNDQRPGAYARVVDRLLSSPRFGERLAAYWLDLVRYADTVGYHGDQDHNAGLYREYVIRALNADMPFDQFTREQLAGDLLAEPTDAQLAASGYNRLLQTTHEGGAQDKEYLAKYAADRVRNLSAVWMGATMGCAECHDHKYDPYTQRDFYSMAAFFADLKAEGKRIRRRQHACPRSGPPEKSVCCRRPTGRLWPSWTLNWRRWTPNSLALVESRAGKAERQSEGRR